MLLHTYSVKSNATIQIYRLRFYWVATWELNYYNYMNIVMATETIIFLSYEKIRAPD